MKNTVPAQSPDCAFLSVNNLSKRYDVHEKTIWRWAHINAFPKPIKLTQGATRWRSADVEAWEAEKIGAAK